jgi:hypothetical protein
MGMERSNIYFSKPQKAALEKIAKTKGISTAELIRRILDEYLENHEKKTQ